MGKIAEFRSRSHSLLTGKARSLAPVQVFRCRASHTLRQSRVRKAHKREIVVAGAPGARTSVAIEARGRTFRANKISAIRNDRDVEFAALQRWQSWVIFPPRRADPIAGR
jgi:hypothetical protein